MPRVYESRIAHRRDGELPFPEGKLLGVGKATDDDEDAPGVPDGFLASDAFRVELDIDESSGPAWVHAWRRGPDGSLVRTPNARDVERVAFRARVRWVRE